MTGSRTSSASRKKIGDSPGVEPPERLIDQLEEIWDRNGREPNEPLNQILVRDGALPNAYEAAQVAGAEEPRPDCTDCSDASPRYYLFENGGDRELLAGPETVERDLYTSVTGERIPKAGHRGRRGPARHDHRLRVPGRPDLRGDDRRRRRRRRGGRGAPGWFAIKDAYALTGDQIEDPQQAFDQFNQPVVQFDFTDSGREAFQEVTQEIARRGAEQAATLGVLGAVDAETAAAFSGSFAVVLDDEAVTRPIINFQENPNGIDGRTGAEISGGFSSPQEAQDIATFLQIGALPVELNLISQSQVSATLGQQALDQGLKAGLIGLLLVVLFLLAYYRFLGLVAAIGLLVYAVFFFALVKLIPITMTLPGIAGLILTIGVAADSNIVIFERIKEEVRAGRSLATSIAVGYRRGIGTIIDANVITLLTAFILFVLATGGVKGFAFTLGIGVIVSLITAVVFTQAFLGVFSRGRLLRSPALLGAGEEGADFKFDFIGLSRWFFSASGVILTVGALALATVSLNFGIDFESGTRLSFAPEQEATVEEVRTALEGTGVEDAEIQEIESEAFGSGFQIQSGTIQPGEVNEVRNALESRDIGIDPGSFENTTVGPTFGEQVARSAAWAILFSLLLIAGYVGFRFEAQVRGAGPDRGGARHPDHRRRLLPGRPGGDQRDRRRVPDDSGLLALRHRHRVRPNTRERPADAARDLLPDRQPLDERGPHAIADHRSVIGVPRHRSAHLRRRDPPGLRLRDDRRDLLGYLLVDLHRVAGAHRLEGARARLRPPPGPDRGDDGPASRPTPRTSTSLAWAVHPPMRRTRSPRRRTCRRR